MSPESTRQLGIIPSDDFNQEELSGVHETQNLEEQIAYVEALMESGDKMGVDEFFQTISKDRQEDIIAFIGMDADLVNMKMLDQAYEKAQESLLESERRATQGLLGKLARIAQNMTARRITDGKNEAA